MDAPIDPADHSVPELREALADVEDPDALTAILDAERAGKHRTTAVDAIEDRFRAVGAEPSTGSTPGMGPDRDGHSGDDVAVRETLLGALWYPWDGGAAGVTLVIGGILTLLSPLVIPAVFVLGYELRVVEAVLGGEDSPPTFRDLESTFITGIKGAIVLFGYVVLPLAIGVALVGAVAVAVGVRVTGGQISLTGPAAAGPIAFALVLLLGGLALVVWYVAPAALVHLGRTRRLRAAFVVDDMRGLVASDVYGSAWLLALAIFAGAGVVLAVLYAAAFGVIVSGFVTFYAFTAMTYLYVYGAEAAGFTLDLPAEHAEDASSNTE